MVKLDRRRKYYIVLDCETATLSIANKFTGEAKKRIAIAKPLIYDLGYKVVDALGRTYERKSFLIQEIFCVPAIFNTAHYKDKREIYLERLAKGETQIVSWENAMKELLFDLERTEATGAFNSMFDFKKALPFTEEYISRLYDIDYYEWEQKQNATCERIAAGEKMENTKEFDQYNFNFRGADYPMFCLWGLACEYLINNDEYKQYCIDYGRLSPSLKYFSTNAETVFRYLSNNNDFIESHTAIDDADIETEIFAKVMKKIKKIELGIIYFPFRELGTVERFEIEQSLRGMGK